MAVCTSLEIFLVVAVTTEAAQEILFDPKVTFKPNASSQLLEITFERQELFSVLNQSEANVNTFQCSLRKNGSVLGGFKQNGPNNIVPFIVIIAHDPCEHIEDISIRCEIELAILENEQINATSKVFSYEGSSDLFNSPCDMSVYYALTIGNIFPNHDWHKYLSTKESQRGLERVCHANPVHMCILPHAS